MEDLQIMTEQSEKVTKFHHILLWNLQIDLEKSKDLDSANSSGAMLEQIESQITEAPNSQWKLVKDLFPLINSDETKLKDNEAKLKDGISYDTFHYFHSFVQRFLFPREGIPTSDRAMLLFERDDITYVDIQLTANDSIRDYKYEVTQNSSDFVGNQDNSSIEIEGNTKLLPSSQSQSEKVKGRRYDVPRVQLYVFNTQIVLLAVEISSNEPHDLEDIQNLQDKFRRVYPPYFSGNEEKYIPNCPFKVKWLDENRKIIAESDYENSKGFEDHSRKFRQSPASQHWVRIVVPPTFRRVRT